MLLSICVITYNRTQYLDELLQSIHDSSSLNASQIELVILDNGSNNETKRHLAEWQKRITFKLLINEQNERGFSAYKKLIEAAEGEWIICPGDDDRFTRNGLSTVINRCSQARGDTSLIAFGAITIDINGNRTPIEFEPKKFASKPAFIARALFESPFWMPATAIRRSAIKTEQMPLSLTVVDWWLWINAGLKGLCMPTSDKVVEYRLHEGQEQRSYLKESWDLDRALSLINDIKGGSLRDWVSTSSIEELEALLDCLTIEFENRDLSFLDKLLLTVFCQEISRKEKTINAKVKSTLLHAQLDPRFLGPLLDVKVTAEDYIYALSLGSIKSHSEADIAKLELQLTEVLMDKRNQEVENSITPFEKKIVKVFRGIRFNKFIRRIFKK